MGSIAPDAFLVPTVDQEVIDNFNCLQQTGDFCRPQKLDLAPFIQEMPIPPDADDVVRVEFLPDMPTSAVGRPHQRFDEFPPVKLYEMRARAFEHRFHPDLAPSTIWGYSGFSPGPLFKARYGEPILVRIHNDLPPQGPPDGFGIPEITTHLHNHHTASESDGFAGDFYPVGVYHDHHYPNILAGGDPREALGTLWYHDHRVDFTAQNVYKGLAGMFWLYDELDSGDENDPNPKALRLPSGEYDVPLILGDKAFDMTPDHQLFMDVFNVDGFLGDHVTVNGVVKPYFKVARRKYRFRLLNTGPSRFYKLALSSGDRLVVIANDGNLLPHPVNVDAVRLAPAERMDVVVDFSSARIGDEIYLVNIMDQINGAGPTGIELPLDEGDKVLKFIVDRDAPDPSRVPNHLRQPPQIEPHEIVRTRVFEFDRASQGWTINGKLFDFTRIDEEVKRGTAERWILRNMGEDWAHPVHIHLEEHTIVARRGVTPLDQDRTRIETGRKDVTVIDPGEEIEILIRFRDWTGRYPIHCHNTVHEDHAMMLRFEVVP